MDVRDADLLKELDPAELGQRIRAARVAKGWTQTQLAGDDISVGYVSRIESGQRRPNSQTLDDLVSSLALVIGWEAFIVLLDVRGLSPRKAREVTLRTTEAILDAALAVGRRV